ncbi:hypothetical protein V5799_008866, partial [Amblyomma americanum]
FPLPVQRVTVVEGNATSVNFTVNRRYAKWSREHDFLIGENGEPKYLGADELTNLLMQLRQNYSDIVEVKDSFGSPGETALQFLRITAPSKKVKPEVVLIGGLNGARPAGREMLIRLARHLVTGYKLKSQRIVDLLQKVVVHIVPSVDKAGFSHSEEGICDSDPSDDGDTEDHFGNEFHGQFPVVEAVKEGLGVSHYVAGLVLDTGGVGVRIALNETNSGLLDNLTMDGLVAGFRKLAPSQCGKELKPVHDGSLLQYAYTKHGTLMIMASSRIHIAPMLDPDGITTSSIGHCDSNESTTSDTNLFYMFDGSLVLLVMVTALCLYAVVMSQRQPERAGFMPVQSNGGTLFDDDDDDDGIRQQKSRKASGGNAGSGVHSKLLKAAEYHDETSSEDEIYNTRNWKSSAK